MHTFVVKSDKTLFCCGWNHAGQLGLGDNTNRNILTELNIDDIKQISSGYYHSVILKNDGTVWSCGANNYGQLGAGDNTNRNVFTKVDISHVKSISCWCYGTLILKDDNSIWSCGYNQHGELGLGDYTNRNVFTKVDIDNVKKICALCYSTFIIKNDGTVWSCGCNSSGQLGLGDYTDRSTFTKVDIDNVISFGNNWNNEGTGSMRYIVKLPNGYYTLENNNLVEITDSITPEITNSRGVDIKTIQDNLANISDSFSLVSVDSVELSINALNVASPIVIQKESVELDSKLGHIDLISSEYELGDESGIRVVFKINGMTWYTFHEGEFKILTNFDIPNKPLDELSDTELTKLQKSIQAIAECGIDIKEINNIDFNKLDIKSIKLAFIIGSNNTESLAKIKNLKIQYDCDADMVLIKDLATTIRDDKLSVSTNNNYGKLKVNVVANKL